jgi:hypothetical protein
MFWLPAMALAGLVSGKLGNDAKQAQQRKTANVRAAEIEASPWTGNAPSTQVQYASSPWGDMLQGGLNGAQAGMEVGKAVDGGGAWEGMMSKGAEKTGGFEMPTFGSRFARK